jgi:SAM-dependent methyltransferase
MSNRTMSEDDRVKWDERYASGDYEPRTEPSPQVEAAIELIPPGRALVLACGTGRNAIRLAEAGFDVEAVDVSGVAIDRARAESARRGLAVGWQVGDLDDLELEPQSYDLITMIRFLRREIWPTMIAALRRDGWLLQVQHFRSHRDVVGPSDLAFRLRPGELLEAFSGLRIVQYSEMVEPGPEGDTLSATASLLACSGDPGW